MNGQQYMQTQMTLIELSKKVETLDLAGFLKSISNAETMAPMLDPTLYRKAAANLEAVKKLAEAFHGVQVAFVETRSTIIQTTIAQMQLVENKTAWCVQCGVEFTTSSRNAIVKCPHGHPTPVTAPKRELQ